MNLSNAQAKVREFMQVFGQECPASPTTPSEQIRELRQKLILEECAEYINDSEELVGAADAIGDLLYVVLGTAVAHGIEIEPIFNEIHRSNMTKLWSQREICEDIDSARTEDLITKSSDPNLEYGFIFTGDSSAAPGVMSKRYCAKRKDGKVIKSPSYEPANLGPIITLQLERK